MQSLWTYSICEFSQEVLQFWWIPFSIVSLEDVWGRIDGKQTGVWKHDMMFCWLRFSMCPALFLTPLVTIPQAGWSWRTTSLFQGSLAQAAPGGGHDSLWLPANLIITAALLAHRRLLRLLPAHRFPRSQPWSLSSFHSPLAHLGPELGCWSDVC